MNGNNVAAQPSRRAITIGFYLAAATGAIGAAILLYYIPPTEATWWYPRCYLYWTTGLHCPGCGATRSVGALVRGDLPQAAAYNLLFVALLPFLALWLLLRQLGLWTGWHWLCLRWPNWLIYTLLVVAIAFGIARNLPLEPFSLLAPHVLE